MILPNKNSHIAIFAFPYSTHAPPLFYFTCKLARFLPDANFSFFNIAESNTNFRSILASSKDLKNVKVYDVEDGIPENYVFSGYPTEKIDLFMNASPGNFEVSMEKAVADVGGAEIRCIIADSFLWFVADMGKPWISFWTAGACSMSTHYYTDLIRETVGIGSEVISSKMDQAIDFIQALSHVRIRDLQDGIVTGPLDSLFARMLHRMAKMTPRCEALVLNTFEDLEPLILSDLRSQMKACLAIGPLNLQAPLPPVPDTTDCLTWLDTQAPASVVYISFGTARPPPETEIVALAEALEECGTAFIWSLNDKLQSKLPSGFLKRTNGKGLVISWVPQIQVLCHVATEIFVSHCGWNSVLESIEGKVPMLCRPILGDQKLNVRMVTHVWEIGVAVKDGIMTKESVIDGLDSIRKNDVGNMMRNRLEKLKNLARAAVAGPEGSSMRSYSHLVELISRV